MAFDQEHVMFSLHAERVSAAGGNCEHAVHCLRQELLVACNLLVRAKHERLAEFVGESKCGCYIGVFAGSGVAAGISNHSALIVKSDYRERHRAVR